MEKEQGKLKEILPSQGIWSVEDLANFLDLPPATVQQKLTIAGVKVIHFSSRYKHKLFRLEDFGSKADGLDRSGKKTEGD